MKERPEFQKYFDIFITHGMFPKITIPMRFSKFSASLINQMFCKLKDPKQHLLSLCRQVQVIRSLFLYIGLCYIKTTQTHAHIC